MASNSTRSSQAGSDAGQSSDDVANLVVAIVALIISIIAFVIAVLQALQQYFSTATGYASCGEAVMGKWAAFTHRRMKWSEFRFRVEFAVPVIFVSTPANRKGPLGPHDQTPIVVLDGSPASFEASHTRTQTEFNQRQSEKGQAGAATRTRRQDVHTADNEEASWLALLMALERMEAESRGWQRRQQQAAGYVAPVEPPAPHSLVACLQTKTKSWDSMPASLSKPYAYTTLSHLVEMAAMLGVYWKEFDRNEDRYRAQGNGFGIFGSYVDGLGVAFSFQKVGPTWFEENRVVPNYKVKELCFGFCPTIFRGERDVLYADEPKDKGTLQLGSRHEIAETLAVFGCNTQTVDLFRKGGDTARHSHLFPVPFEILGMVGIVLQLKNTAFRMLPNPTVYVWDTASFSLRTLLRDYASALDEHGYADDLLRDNTQVDMVLSAADDVEQAFARWEQGSSSPAPSIAKVDDDDSHAAYAPDTLAALHASVERCDAYLTDPERVRLVQQVLREHVQEVLAVLNPEVGGNGSGGGGGPDDVAIGPAAADAGGSSLHPGGVAHREREAAASEASQAQAEFRARRSVLRRLDSASPAGKHRLAAELYVGTIRARVVRALCHRHHDDHNNSDNNRQAPGGSGRPRRERRLSATTTTSRASASPARPRPGSLGERDVNDIWCVLVLRAVCWLLLHDFHKKDVQISKSDVFNSRMPVYIT